MRKERTMQKPRKKRRLGRKLLLILLLALIAVLTWSALSPLPETGVTEMSWLKEIPIAHRGLHTSTAAENSLPAFGDAIDAGYCVEFDLRLCASGEIVVIHDANLKRVSGREGKVAELTLDELRDYELINGGRVSTLQEALDFVDSRTPLLIEIKPARGTRELADKMLPLLDAYGGEFAIQSFDPWLCRYVKGLRPDWQVGLLDNGLGFGPAWLRLALDKLLIRVCRPDFISYRYQAILPAMLDDYRARGTAVLAYWTTEDQIASGDYLERADNIIFDREPLIGRD